jgi:tRNA(Ile)-lysidine synthase
MLTIALSAGSDSISVAHFLKTKYPKQNIRCVHYNHKLRLQNERMNQKAKRFCETFHIPFIERHRERGEDGKVLSEMDLRTLRYKSFSGLGTVVTGHHLDDAVESYIMNCFNGVPEYLPIPLETEYKNDDFTVIRPFIFTKKEDIEKYILENSLQEFVEEDETNNDQKYRRNWVRHRLCPVIKEQYNLRKIVKKRYLEKLKEIS